MSYQAVMIGDFKDLPYEVRDDSCFSSLSNNGAGRKYASYILIYIDGKLANIESDAMEPEDATFYRDLNWIVDALNDAYEKGLKDGKGG